MKLLIAAISALVLGLAVVSASPTPKSKQHLLGAAECTWGPSYWCSNLTNAANCGAVRHCIQTIWEKHTYPEDHDSVCDICLKMVKQARDQLESNETQEDIKAVFEGSCRLILLKPIVKECIKLSDEFIPELVESLASQMNPNVVCSVAGLCNSPRIDKMLAKHKAEKDMVKYDVVNPSGVLIEPKETKTFTCSGCYNIGNIIANKFKAKNEDDVLEDMLYACRGLSSFSDACSSIVLTHFGDIYKILRMTMDADSICHMSGVCANRYHRHEGDDVEVLPRSDVGFVPVRDDIPCELCEQLMKHLKEVLVANTTESEFKLVLEGLCKQTGGFKDECMSIVDQYYHQIYTALIGGLDDGACFMIGICQKNLQDAVIPPLAPLLPVFDSQEVNINLELLKPEIKLGAGEPKLSHEEVLAAQLPVDKLMGAPLPGLLVENGQLCTLCEYFLHFVQEALSSQKNADEIKKVVESTCNKLPKTIRGECDDFVEMYGDAVIALLVQSIDPRQVCPMLKMCPEYIEDMEVFSPKEIHVTINTEATEGDKPTCPLCLFAVKEARDMILENKTKENIKHALDRLCLHLPKKLLMECTDFVETYSNELVQMLITDFTPQQICSYLKLCSEKVDNDNEDFSLLFESNDDEDLMTNEIFDFTVNGRPINKPKPKKCALCEKFVRRVENSIVNKQSDEQIIYALKHACDTVGRALKNKCKNYIQKHEQELVAYIKKGLNPKDICINLHLCDSHIEKHYDTFYVSFPHDFPPPPPSFCGMCHAIVNKATNEATKENREDIKRDMEKMCGKYGKNVEICRKTMEKLGDKIVDEILNKMPVNQICQSIGWCGTEADDLDIDEALSLSVIALPAHYQPHSPSLLPRYTVGDDIVEPETIKDTPPCVLCEFVMVKLEQELKNKKTKDEVKHIVERICHVMPKTINAQCTDFIEKYGELIITMIDSVPPKEICMRLNLCASLNFEITDSVVECGICHGTAVALSDIIKDVGVDQEIEVYIEKACVVLPAKYYKKCSELMKYYGDSLINMLKNQKDLSKVCSEIGMCFENEDSELSYVNLEQQSGLLQKQKLAMSSQKKQ